MKGLDSLPADADVLCGDIGESLEDPIQYSIHTLLEMQVLGMDPRKENWDAWSVNVKEKDFKKKVSDFKPELIQPISKTSGKMQSNNQDLTLPSPIRFVNVRSILRIGMWRPLGDRFRSDPGEFVT
jgi:hypothetical protein